jgi:transcriptional regulator with XRE-family HTH domain
MRKKASARKTPAKKRHADIVRLFAQRLRELRLSRGLTQEALARQAFVTVPYIGKLERAGAAPGIDLVERIASALGVTAVDLMPMTNETPALTILRSRASERFKSILERADESTLVMLCPLLAVIDDALARAR